LPTFYPHYQWVTLPAFFHFSAVIFFKPCCFYNLCPCLCINPAWGKHSYHRLNQMNMKIIKVPLNEKKRLFEAALREVENIGVEPMTFCMPCKRSSQLS